MEDFEGVYQQLNAAQKKAVDTIDGPVLVVAGPGTGKTQLLSARVAQILRKTDTLPQNILCLTFTESGAQNMRDRLSRFIGKNSYDVAISTYHAFGGDLIRRYPEYFLETRLEQPIDELGKRQILTDIVDNLNYRSPLKQTRHHLGDLMSTISEVKRGLLTPDSLRDVSKSNLRIIEEASKVISETLAPFIKRLPSKIDVAEPVFGNIYGTLNELAEVKAPHPKFESLAKLAKDQLEIALNEASGIGKTTPLTKWKNTWLVKNAENQYILAGALEAARMYELAVVLEAYTTTLDERGLYDFDDMILRAITALEQNPELKYTLQEQYQYVLLDEFQDTNAAQLELVKLLTDNPTNESHPNVLAVGDDDQAIYAFQGAQYSNMLDYFRLYKDVVVVNLNENYRSTPEILETAQNIASQITDNLAQIFPELTKDLLAANTTFPKTQLERIEYQSEVAENAGIAEHIAQLLEQGTSPSEIAILAPKHKNLEPLLPYLHAHGIPVRYERRENILEAPVIRQLLTMSKLVLALHGRKQALADSLWPEILSYDFWQFPVSSIWRLSWDCAEQRKPWSELLLANDTFRPVALLFLTLAGQVETETLETMLDRLIGTEEVLTHEADIPQVRSKLRSQLLEDDASDAVLYQTVTELTVLRARLREHGLQQERTLGLIDLLKFVGEYEAAGEQMVNTSPYSEAADAVQLLTVFKAKGLEFAHVFLLNCHDNVWGGSSRGNSNKLTLPANLAPIRHAGTTEDERLRIFYVALTRAKYGLYLTSHRATYAGKRPPRLKYLDEIEQPDGSVRSQTLPSLFQKVIENMNDAPTLEALEQNWQNRHLVLSTPLKELLHERLERYRLSPTHLTKFIDLEYAGPQSFLLDTILRFPSAPNSDSMFGNAMHETLEWLQQQINIHGQSPLQKATLEHFRVRLEKEPLTSEQLAIQQARGTHALEVFLQDSATHFMPGNKPEHNFRDEGVVLEDNVHMGGKIDLLEIDKETKTITVIDYKTGSLGTNKTKLHKYELQLYCYKILLEHSHSFAGYRVEKGVLVFVEPDDSEKIVRRTVTFTDVETKRVIKLLSAMWHHVRELDMPDISGYGKTLVDIKEFEQALIGLSEKSS